MLFLPSLGWGQRHFVFVEHYRTIGENTGGRSTETSFGYEETFLSGFLIGSKATVLYSIGWDNVKNWSGLEVFTGYVSEIGKKNAGLFGAEIIAGNVKNWQIGFEIRGGMKNGRFETLGKLGLVNFIDHGLHPYGRIGLNIKYRVYENRND